MKKLLFICLLVLICPLVWGQEIEWELISVVPVKGLEQVSFDNRSQIFYTTRAGSLYQLSPNGVPLNHFSPPRQGSITQLEAGWTVNIFAFSKDLQRYEIYDRFLNPLVSRELEGMDIGLAKAATLGNNHSLWVFDESDLSLKRIDYRRQAVLQNQPLGLVLEEQAWNVVDMKEHQNMLFLRVPDEVVIFDNQGNYLRRLHVPGESQLSIHDQNLYVVHEGKLELHPIGAGAHRAFNLPDAPIGEHVLVHGDRLVFFGKDQISVFANPFIQNKKRNN